MFRSTLIRLLAIFLMLAFGTIVRATPISEVREVCVIGCTTGNQVVAILIKLKADIQLKLDLLDAEPNAKADPSENTKNMIVLLQQATTRIADLPKDSTGKLDGKTQERTLYCAIYADVTSYVSKWALIKTVLGTVKNLGLQLNFPEPEILCLE